MDEGQLLRGRITYSIVCSLPSKKRTRPWEDESTTSLKSNSSIFRRGFIFVAEEGGWQGQEYSLVVPYQLLRIASHAASSGKLVQISHYCLLRYEDDWGEVLFSSGDVRNKKQKAFSIDHQERAGSFVIEVFVDGLSIVNNDDDGEEIQSPVLTLETLAQNECLQPTTGTKKKSQNKKPINVTGVVDAISPILVNDPQQEPFAIMELYQPPLSEEEQNMKTAVVIIRGERALSMHPAIHPGHAITLLNVVHRKWKVPDEFRKRALNEKQSNERSLFMRLCNRVQGRVILVTEASSIRWNDGNILKPNLSLPSTDEALTSIRGIVKSVNYHCDENRNGKANRVLHFVTIQPLTASQNTDSETAPTVQNLARIYMPKHATPPQMILGLQAGSTIRAVNIHSISPPIGDEKKFPICSCYATCLRSTISIERCAGEYVHRNRLPNIWYVPSCKPFLLVSDHRISDICSDRLHSRSSAQLRAEANFRHQLQNNCHVTHDISSEALSAVLIYHYQMVGDCVQPVTNCEKSRCKEMLAENAKIDRQTIRDPYAEFFDHSQNNDLAIECGLCSSSFACFNHYQHSTSETMPIVIGPEHLRNACTQRFTREIGTQAKTSDIQAGWTSSFNFKGLKLLQVLNDYFMQSDMGPIAWSEKDSIHFYTGGHITYADETTTTAALLRNDICVIPILEGKKSEGTHSRSGFPFTKPNELEPFGWAHMDCVNVSCVCLGPCTKKKTASVHAGYHHVFLPASYSDAVSGHTFLFLVDNLVFVGSMYIVARSIMQANVDQSWIPEQSAAGNDAQIIDQRLGIAACLEQTATSHQGEDPSIICGRLMRQRFKFRKVKSIQRASDVTAQLEKCYEGWSVTMCHIDHSEERGHGMASMLQTIEVSISIPFCNSSANHAILKSGLRELFKSNSTTNSGAQLSFDQEIMCLAWWHASGCQTLPILSGGLDLSIDDSISAYVEFPLSARAFAKLGYQRFRCHVRELKAYHIVETHAPPTQPLLNGNAHMNSHKMLPGMLNRRFQRIMPLTPSPLAHVRVGGGIQQKTLADLHWDICKAIRYGDSSYLKPSLLRRIHNVKILGISFCRARVECEKCFQPLVKKFVNTDPIKGDRREDSTLLCPSDCSQSRASVKWECSAIVDDGTGQAKLYAEREAALLLLGADFDVATVEKGAWCCEEGVFFQPSLPPSSSLAQSIRTASIQARKHISSIKKKHNIDEELSTAFGLLPVNPKAEYLLQQHCRHWIHHHGQRRLDLFCRCKPLSEDLSLNGTEINVAKAMVVNAGLEFGMTATATLPPLKLTLEDACVCSEERKEDKLLGWELLQHLK